MTDYKGVWSRIDSHLLLKIEDLPMSAIRKLKESFTRSNPKFWKMKKMGKWTGNTPQKLISWSKEGHFLILPKGAISKISKILLEFNCILDPIINKTIRLPSVGFEITERLILRIYQEEAIKALIEAGSGTVRGPCGSGKTILLIGAIVELDQPCIVIVHSKLLAQQWRASISSWLGIQPGIIEGGKKIIKPITVATQKSVWRAIEKNDCDWIKEFAVMVGDEVHRWASKTFLTVTNAFSSAHRIGASADERRQDGLEYLIYETFGDVVYKIPKQELIEIGNLVPSRMEVIPTNYSDELYLESVKNSEMPDWVGMISRLVEDEERNELIFSQINRILFERSEKKNSINNSINENLLKNSKESMFKKNNFNLIKLNKRSIDPLNRSNKDPLNGVKGVNTVNGVNGVDESNDFIHPETRILLLNDRVETCKKWVGKFRSLGIPTGLLIGGPENERELEDSIKGLRNGTLLIGVGTTVADEGLDIPSLTHVFITCPGHKHPKRMEQRIGRAARVYGNKKEAVCVYFWDNRMFPFRQENESGVVFEKKVKKLIKSLGKIVDKIKILNQ